MWSTLFLCLLATSAIAVPEWREHSEYQYEVRGRTLTGLHEVAPQYSGLLYKAVLRIQPRSQGRILQAQITNPRFAQVHTYLKDGFNSEIPESELSWKRMELSSKPFQILTEDGEIKGLKVSEEIEDWEENIIKGIVSQFQMKISERSQSSEEENSSEESKEGMLADFTVMEDTVTGETETFYKVNKLPEYILPSIENFEKIVEEAKNGGLREVFEVTKHKNYSLSVNSPSYIYGLGGLKNSAPFSNKVGSFLTRGSFSRAILSGDLSRYTIHNTYTISEILVNPTLMDKQKGSVYSMVNITLENIERSSERIEEVENPIEITSLVYSNDYLKEQVFGSPNSEYKSEKYRSPKNPMFRKFSRYEDDETNEYYRNDLRMLHQGSVKNPHISKPLVIQNIKKLCKEIAEDLQNPYTMLLKGTMNKFTILNTLVRQLKANDLKQIADELYDARQASERDAWKIFRDSVAVCGNEPALMTIKEWILSSRISDAEAALVVSSMAKSVRQASVQYLKEFFEVIKENRVLSEWPLNDTALLSFSQLVRETLTDGEYAKNQFPLRTLREIRSQEGMTFLKRTIIPYFTEQLNKAIQEAQTHKIHVYIQVLGNIAHPQILMAFKPYLEGEKQVSQFQRLLMVLSMDDLAQLYPEHVREVFMRLYENVGENPHVRAVAVYQIMRTRPSAEILQYMASYTNVDKHEIVSAAVKSVIEGLSKFEEEGQSKFRRAVESAKPLLTKKNFGMQDGAAYVRSHLVEDLKTHFAVSAEIVGSGDQFYPRGIRYGVAKNFGGLRDKFSVQVMVSHIDEVMNVFNQQTEKHSKNLKLHKQAYEEQSQHKLSSQYVAEMLNLEPEEREQLEGSLYLEQGILQGMLSFDNTTVPRIMRKMKDWEEELNAGKQIQYTNFFSGRSIVVSFPTEMGFLFAFTYETPSMIRVHGSIKAASNPKISQDKLHKPDSLELKSDLTVTVTSKVQGRVSFLTLFNRQQYISGYDRHVQVHLPIRGRFEWDVKRKQVRAELETENSQDETRLFHYSTWPYTSRASYDIMEPLSLQPHTRIIKQENVHSFEKVIGHKETGIALKIEVEHERSLIDLQHLNGLVYKHGLAMGMLSLWNDAEIQYSQINVTHVENESSTKKVIFRLGSTQEYTPKSKVGQGNEVNLKQSSEERQESALKNVIQGIKNAKGRSYDAIIEFKGDKEIKYVLTSAYAKSNIDPISRLMVKGWKKSDIKEEKDYSITLTAQNVVENTNEIDMKHSLETEPKLRTEIKFSVDKESEKPTELDVKLEMKRSEERKRYLEKQLVFKQCQSEMREGDYMMLACQNMSMNYNLMDDIQADIKYKNIPRRLLETLKAFYYGARFNYYPNTEVDIEETSEQNQVKLQGRFDHDLRSVNVSIKTPEQKTIFKNIPVSEMAKRVIVIHPVYRVRSRLMALALGLETYRPTCVVDQNKISTFLNKVYPADLSDKWTVMFQFLPKQARQEEKFNHIRDQLKQQTENYVILVKKDSDSNKRQVKISLSTPNTELQVMDITLKPTQEESCRAKVMINGEDAKVSKDEPYQYGNGYIQIYVIPNGEVKIEIKNQFDVVFDGERVKVSLLNGRFRDAIRGICGQYNDKYIEEFLTPANCIVRDHEKFIKSYEVEGSSGQEIRRKMLSSNNIECLRKKGPMYVTLMKSTNEAEALRECRGYQTRYVEKGDEICFTIHPVRVCSRYCQPTSLSERSVPVHCIKQSSVTQLWKKQIDNGGSPDFSHKSETRSESIEIPEVCA